MAQWKILGLLMMQWENRKPLTLIYPAHFEDVPCQSGVNHIYEGKNDYVSR